MTDAAGLPEAQDEAEAGDGLSAAYDELRRLAAGYLRSERSGHTLQPTALVHEAFLKLASGTPTPWRDEGHFRALAASAMRQILVDHARRRATDKRGGNWLRVTLAESDGATDETTVDLLALDEALTALDALDARKSRVVELRFFGGLTAAETAAVLDIARKTVDADWYMARAWLRKLLSEGSD